MEIKWMRQKRGCNLSRVILAPAFGAKRKSTTAVTKEVALPVERQPWQLFVIARSPEVFSKEDVGGGSVMAVITAFPIAPSFCHFTSLQSTLIFRFNPECPEFCSESTPAFTWHNLWIAFDVRERSAVCFLGRGVSSRGWCKPPPHMTEIRGKPRMRSCQNTHRVSWHI